MITDVEYMQLVNEVYDLSDYNTKKEVLFCNEAKKAANVEHIVGKLYDHIKTNCDAIDFGTIPKSKGVVTRIENYQQIVDCLNTIGDLIGAYNEDPKSVNVLLTCLDNIQKRERIFTKAFALNIEFPIMMYETATIAIVSGTSLLITSSIEYIKNGHDSFAMSLDKAGYVKTKDHVFYQYAEEFNTVCANGTLDKMMEACIKNNITVQESSCVVNEGLVGDVAKAVAYTYTHQGAASASGYTARSAAKDAAKNWMSNNRFIAIIISIGVSIGIIIFLFKILRMFIFVIKRWEMKFSDWLDAQATFLQINAENLKYRNDDKGDDHKKVVYQRQTKWVEHLRRLSNIFALKDSKAQKEAKKDEEEFNRKRQYENDDDNGGLF